MRVAVLTIVLSALAFALPAAAQQTTPVPHDMDADAARAGRDFWSQRASRQVRDWATTAFPQPDSIPVSRGRQQIGGVNGRRAYMSWSRQLTHLRGGGGICDPTTGNVFWYERGEAEVTYRSVNESGGGANSFYNQTTPRWVGYRSRTPLDLTLTDDGATVEVERTAGTNFDRDYDVLERFSRAFSSGMGRLRPLTVRFNEAERAAFQRDPAAFEWGLHLAISDACGV